MKNSSQSKRSAVPFPRRFGYRFNMIGNALGQHMLRYVQREHGLNLAEYRVLASLEVFEALSIRDIAKHSQLDKAHATRTLAVLTERGLASQVVDGRDRRLRVVRLTAAGQTIMNAIKPFMIERQRRLEQCLTPNELRVLDKALLLLLEEAERMVAEIEAASERRHAIPIRPAAISTPRR
jgi:DNA-binding MarR family transcriptional regulator